jgi:hypothetical protein
VPVNGARYLRANVGNRRRGRGHHTGREGPPFTRLSRPRRPHPMAGLGQGKAAPAAAAEWPRRVGKQPGSVAPIR